MKDYKEMAESVFQRSNIIIEERHRRRKTITKAISIGCCFCVLFALSIGVGHRGMFKHSELKAENDKGNKNNITDVTDVLPYSVVTGYGNGSKCCYAAPENGKFFCFMEVKAAIEQYKNDDTAFLLAIDIFRDGKEVTEEEKRAEYQRLLDEGYSFYKSTYWYYEGSDMKKVEYTVILGVFTEKQLIEFKPDARYGYAFHFVTNGDGSFVGFDKNNAIRSFD